MYDRYMVFIVLLWWDLLQWSQQVGLVLFVLNALLLFLQKYRVDPKC